MFFSHFKEYFLKRKLKKSQKHSIRSAIPKRFCTVGLLVDESVFTQTLAFKKVLSEIGFSSENISILAYRKDVKELSSVYPYISWKQVDCEGQIKDQEIVDFIQQPFDLLISYYLDKKTLLQWISYCSNAKFKVGLFTSEKHLNDLMIHTQLQDYQEFIQEMNRILKLFNKN